MREDFPLAPPDDREARRFSPQRLAQARQRRGLTKTKLAAATHLSVRILTAYEAGERVPSSDSLGRLAQTLKFPPRFFFLDNPHQVSSTDAHFRSMKSMTASQRDAALAAAELALDFCDWLRIRVAFPDPVLPNVQTTGPEDAADSIRKEWGLGQKPVDNMVRVLEDHGVRVFSLAEDCRQVDAFSLWFGSEPFVFLNTKKSGERSRLDAAHELGHLVLHQNGKRGREAEHEAMRFGSAFLMPRVVTAHISEASATLEELLPWKHYWKVSIAAVVYRLHALGALTEWNYRSLMIDISRRGWRTSEPFGMPHERSHTLAQALSDLRQLGYSKPDIADELGVSLRELRGMIFALSDE